MTAPLATYALNVLLGVDVLANALIGGQRYMTISGRIGHSIKAGGWASRVPWPQWWINHCLASDYEAEV